MVVNATCRDSSRISNVLWPRGSKSWKDKWACVSQEARSDIFHLVMRLGFAQNHLLPVNEWIDERMNQELEPGHDLLAHLHSLNAKQNTFT